MTAIGVSTGLSLGRGAGLPIFAGFTPLGIVFDGDSITETPGSPDPWTTGQFVRNTGIAVTNRGRSGYPLASGGGASDSIDASYATNTAPSYNASTRNTLCVLGGVNDILTYSGTDQTLRAAAISYAAKARATGFKVVFGTITPTAIAGWNPTKEGYRVAFNLWLRANWNTFCDGIIDYASVPNLQDPTNGIFYQDLLHPFVRGGREFAEAARKAFGIANVNDTTPSAFSFTAVTGAAISTVYTATISATYVLGITAAAAISITGGTYSINGGAFTSAPGTVDCWDAVSVRATSSASSGVQVDAVLTIGGVSGTFSVTTVVATTAFNTTPVAGTATFSNSNKTIVGTSATGVIRTANAVSGKKVFAVRPDAGAATAWSCAGATSATATHPFSGTQAVAALLTNGSIFVNNSAVSNAPTLTNGEIVGVAIDATAKTMWFTKNGTAWFGGGFVSGLTSTQVSAGTSGQSISGLTGTIYGFAGSSDNAGHNFTLVDYPWTIPSGYSQL